MSLEASMRVKTDPGTIAEAILLLINEDLLTDIKSTLEVLANKVDLDIEEGITYYYFNDNSYITDFDGELESHVYRS